jgi:hypothetical protein
MIKKFLILIVFALLLGCQTVPIHTPSPPMDTVEVYRQRDCPGMTLSIVEEYSPRSSTYSFKVDVYIDSRFVDNYRFFLTITPEIVILIDFPSMGDMEVFENITEFIENYPDLCLMLQPRRETSS